MNVRCHARPLGAVAARMIVFVFALCAAPVAAADWPQWLGPNRDGTTTEKVSAWKGDPKVLWRCPICEGHSSPIVSGGVVYLHTKVKDKDEEALLAFDAKSGAAKWQKAYARVPTKIFFGNGPRGTPAANGERVYTFGITGVLSCWDVKGDGKLLWQADTLKQFGAPNLTFGVSASPLIVGDHVIVQVGNNPMKPQETAVVAFEANTGRVAWKALSDPASYAAPALIDGRVVVLTGAHAVGIDPKDGKVVWKHPFRDALNESSSTPVKAGDLVLVSSVTAGSAGLKIVDGKAEQAWKDGSLTCYFSTPLPISKDHAFMVAGKLPPFASATLSCVETATGKVAWSKPKVGTYHASLMRLGDGNVLMLDDSGGLSLLAPDLKEFKQLARSKVCEGKGDVWAHPALADGRLYLRDAKELICLQMAE